MEQKPPVRVCANCLFSEGTKCVWLDIAITRRPPCGGSCWAAKPLFMLVPPEERVFPLQMDEMSPEEREAAEHAMQEAKKKGLGKVQAFFELLDTQTLQAAKQRTQQRWFTNFLNWKLDTEYAAMRDAAHTNEMPMSEAA